MCIEDFAPFGERRGTVNLQAKVKPQAPENKGHLIEDLVPTYLFRCVLAFMVGIFSLFLIGSVIGMIGIVFASKVEKLRDQGRLSKALTASKSAKIWMLSSLAFTAGSLAYSHYRSFSEVFDFF